MTFLDQLKKVKSIQYLNMKGNPICKHPLYRISILSVLPNLIQLDEKQVSQEEIKSAEVKMKKQDSLMELMLSNYCQLIQLNSYLKKLDLHRSLFQKNKQFAQNYSLKRGPPFFQKIIQFELSPETKEQYKQNMMNDVYCFYEEIIQLSPLQQNDAEIYERATTEFMMRQKQKIAELEVKCEKKIEGLTKLAIDINSKYNFNDFEELNQTAKFALESQVNRKQKKQMTPNNKSLQKSRRANSNVEDEIFKNFEDQFSKIEENSIKYSPKNNMQQKIQFQNSIQFQNRSLSPLKDVPQPSLLDIKPSEKKSQDNDTPKIRKSLSESKMKISHNNSIKKPLPQKRDKKSPQPQQKQNKLEYLQQINNKYKQKIKEFYDQNQSNLKLASQEIQKLTQECNKKKEVQNILKSDLDNLRLQVQETQIKNEIQQQEINRLTQIKMVATQYSQQLTEYEIKEYQASRALDFNQKRLQKKFFNRLVFATKTNQLIFQFRQQQDLRIGIELRDEAFRLLKHRYLKKKYVNIRFETMKLQTVSQCFFNWRENIIFQANVQLYQQKKNVKTLKYYFQNMKKFIVISRKKKQELRYIDKFRSKILIRKFYKLFKFVVNSSRYSSNEEKIILKKADNYRAKHVRNSIFTKWKNWFFNYQRTKIQLYQIYKNTYETNLLKKGLQGFITTLVYAYHQDKQADLHQQEILELKFRQIFQFWKYNFTLKNKRKRFAQNLYPRKILTLIFTKLKFLSQEKKYLQLKSIQAQEFYQQKYLQKHFQFLKDNWKRSKILSINSALIKQNLKIQTFRFIFNNWRQTLIQTTKMRKQQHNELRQLMRNTFSQWHKLSMKKKLQNEKKRSTLKFISMNLKVQTVRIFNAWKKQIKRKIRGESVVATMLYKKKFKIFRILIVELLKISRQKNKKNITKIKTQQSLIEADYKQNMEILQQNDKEKQNLIDNIETRTQDNILLQQKIEYIDQQLADNESVISDLKKSNIDYEDYRKIKEKEIKDKEDHINYLNHDFSETMIQKDKFLSQLKIEKQTLISKIDQIKKELEYNTQTLAESQSNLNAKKEKEESLLKTQENKLQNSIQMANEFKQRIIQYEKKIDELNQNLQEKNEEMIFFKVKLQDSIKVFKTSQDKYEQNISQVMENLKNNQDQLSQIEKQNQQYIKNISQMKESEYGVQSPNLRDKLDSPILIRDNIILDKSNDDLMSNYQNLGTNSFQRTIKSIHIPNDFQQDNFQNNEQKDKLRERINELQGILSNTLNGTESNQNQNSALKNLAPNTYSSRSLYINQKLNESEIQERQIPLNYPSSAKSNKNLSDSSFHNPIKLNDDIMINKSARSNLEERIKRLSANLKQDLEIANN